MRRRLEVLAALPALALLSAAPAGAASGFYIRGGGFGHGIGMSQYGALGYALHGWGYPAILSHYYTGTSLGSVSATRTVTVLLQTGTASFSGASTAAGPASFSGASTAAGTASFSGASTAAGTASSSGASTAAGTALSTAAAKALSTSTTYSVSQTRSGQLQLRHGSRKLGPFKAPLMVSGPGPLDLAGAGQYRGSLEFWPQSGGRIETVNALDIEDYVRGVISDEMPSSWPAQALEAQAIAARTYVLTSAPEGSTFEVYPDTRSQMYGGVAAETAATDAAVAATSGQVVTYHGTPVVTYFFASSGGYTASIQDQWPGAAPEPWLVGVPDPYDGAGGNPYHRWSANLTLEHAAGALAGIVKGSLIGIAPTTQDTTPRLLSAEVVGTGGQTRVSGLRLQQIFGLPTNNVAFTTITASAGGSDPGRSLTGGASASPATRAGAGNLQLHGTIFPAAAGATIVIQELIGGAFKTILATRTDAAGAYQANVAGRGRYRVAYHGINGPAISVSGT